MAAVMAKNSKKSKETDTQIPSKMGQKKILTADHLKRMREGRAGAQSTQNRCGLTFPVGILKKRMLKDKYAPRISLAASVWLAGALETVVLEVLDAVVAQTERSRKKCVTSQHVMAALRSDDEFQRIFKNVTIARGGIGGISGIGADISGPVHGKTIPASMKEGLKVNHQQPVVPQGGTGMDEEEDDEEMHDDGEEDDEEEGGGTNNEDESDADGDGDDDDDGEKGDSQEY